MHVLYPFFLVFVGGGLGSICRFALSLWLHPYALRFPWATLAANAAACLVLGLMLGWQTQQPVTDARRLLLTTGFCGGFSTFSTFTAETAQLYAGGSPGAAVLNVAANLSICLLCLYLGIRLTS